ncbi:MAG: DNA repair protein RecO [Clostridiales bacterium]|nr:DNA repair protein RecO [Clostridiales bacterium]
MRLTTDALIIRENNNIGESDRFVTALTRDLGVIRASARGARQLKNRSGAATKLLTYSRLTLFRGRDKYIIDEAEPLQLFFELHSDIERLALAQYFCELAGVLAPREEAAEPCLRLLLNALHYLCTGGRDSRLIKAVVELKLLAFAGYMPNLTACASCGAADAAGFWLLPQDGILQCTACRRNAFDGALPVSVTVLAAMRHILYGPFEKCYSFTLPEDGLTGLAQVSEAFLLAQLGRGFNSLDFYHTL